jgi:hypothetical protein
MSTVTKNQPAALTAFFPRLINEGHGPNAWYGADIVTAVNDVDAATAARRPGPGRHNVAEVALHHAYWLREIRARLLASPTQPFPLDGEDWFTWEPGAGPSWDQVKAILATEVQRLRDAVAALGRGDAVSPLAAEAQFDQVLGISAHGAYHAGQIQLVKALVS